MSSFHEQLTKNHFAEIPLSITHDDLVRSANLFLRFLKTVPDQTKRGIHFKSPFPRGSADGYSDKREIGGKDPKEFVHWGPRLLKYTAYTELYNSSDDARTFFDTAERIYTDMDTRVCQLFEAEFPELMHHCIVDGKLANAVLRFLCYAPDSTVEFNAKPHYDKSFGTVALAESAPGLRIGCCEKHPLCKVIHSEGTALFMPGELMFEYSKRTIIPAWHDVKTDKETTDVCDRCRRWAIVFFIDHKDGNYPSWDAVHSPLNVHG